MPYTAKHREFKPIVMRQVDCLIHYRM